MEVTRSKRATAKAKKSLTMLGTREQVANKSDLQSQNSYTIE